MQECTLISQLCPCEIQPPNKISNLISANSFWRYEGMQSSKGNNELKTGIKFNDFMQYRNNCCSRSLTSVHRELKTVLFGLYPDFALLLYNAVGVNAIAFINVR